MEWSWSGEVANFVSKQLPTPPGPSCRPTKTGGLRRALYASRITESLTPRKQTATEAGLQRRARIPGHFSDARPTPALYDKAYDMASRGFAEIEPVLRRACSGQSHDAMHGGEDEEVLIPPLLLRVRVAKSVRDYEAMRDADSPPPEALVNGFRSLRSLQQMKEEESAATKIQARFRQKQAADEVQRIKKQQKEESDAAARIQAKYRGRQANKQVHVRDDPHCRFHGVTGGNARPKQPHPPVPRLLQAEEEKTKTESRDEKTHYVTQGGLHLLYDPETLDKWISRTIEPTDQGGYRDAQTGETLTPEDEVSCEHYRRRLCERYRTGEQADRLVRIVDRYMPATADESRTYVMKYPHKVLTMLKQAWKARKKIRAKRKRKKQQRGRERSSTSTETKRGMRPQAGTGDCDEYSTFATEGDDQEGAAALLAEDDDYEETGTHSNQPPERSEGSVAGEGQGRPHATRVTQEAQTQASPAMGETTSVVEETPPDWGDEDSPEQEAASATKIQARFRQKQAASEVEGMRQKHAQACSNRLDEFRQRISVKVDVVLEANGRAVVNVQLAAKDGVPGTSDNEIDIPMNDETAQAATKIQAKFRQKQAAGEVDAKRKEKEQMHDATDNEIDIPMNDETAQAATKIQAKFRQKQAAGEVEAKRKEKEEMHTAAADNEIDIPMNDETAQAATKIQAKFRQKQAAGEVEAKRKEKEEMHSAAADNEIDIPMNDETAQAATKIQAKFRQKQAAGEVDAKRKEKEQMHDATDNEIDIPMDDETAQAATKIQAKFRQKQAASEVEAMRKEKLKSESGDAAEAEPPADEISEVEAMLKEKEKEQQQLVEDNSPKVEGMFGSKQEKRPMAVSPAIPEGGSCEQVMGCTHAPPPPPGPTTGAHPNLLRRPSSKIEACRECAAGTAGSRDSTYRPAVQLEGFDVWSLWQIDCVKPLGFYCDAVYQPLCRMGQG
eukprot:s2258_g8.t1